MYMNICISSYTNTHIHMPICQSTPSVKPRQALRPPPRRRSQRDRSPPPLPVGEVEPPKAAADQGYEGVS